MSIEQTALPVDENSVEAARIWGSLYWYKHRFHLIQEVSPPIAKTAMDTAGLIAS